MSTLSWIHVLTWRDTKAAEQGAVLSCPGSIQLIYAHFSTMIGTVVHPVTASLKEFNLFKHMFLFNS